MFLCVNPFSNNLFGNPLERWGKRCFPRPETHAVDEHVGLSRFQWPSWLLEGKKKLTLKSLKLKIFEVWIKVSQDVSRFWISAIQEVKTQKIRASKFGNIHWSMV